MIEARAEPERPAGAEKADEAGCEGKQAERAGGDGDHGRQGAQWSKE